MNIVVRYVFSFLALIPITTMLSGDVLYRWFPLIGEGLIWIGTIGQLLFASVRISALWKDGTFEQKSTFATILFTLCRD